ncbi:MAG TPA: glucose dehydrogenase [Alphaproteobacteria bacterium]|nr:glucose dehydrogenase [Alphaproteobacteria bacterium]
MPQRRLALAALLPLLGGCYAVLPSAGGGQTAFEPPRRIDAADVAVPAGYRIEAVASGLTFPTNIAFDEAGALHVVESGYSYGEVWTAPRLLRIAADGTAEPVATGGRNGPWTGAVRHGGRWYIAEGGQGEGGRILRQEPDGRLTALVEGLPSLGDHHTDTLALGPDGWLYFGQGTATNSGVVGPDAAEFGWLHRHPDFHDTPCRDVTLSGANFTSHSPLEANRGAMVTTGPYKPYGTPARAGEAVPGRLPCNGAVLRIRPEGGPLELVAWGFRNPFGLAFAPDGALYVTDNAYDERGSRPVFGAGDLLWRVRPGQWHGWPDYSGSERLDDADRFGPPGGPAPPLLLRAPPNIPPAPAARLGVHSSSNGIDFSRSPRFGHVGEAFVAQFGDQAPMTGKVMAPVGYRVVRVDVATGTVHDFAANRGRENGPASWLGGGGLERPLGLRFSPDGDALYIADFGVMTMEGEAPAPRQGTGVVWRVSRTGG